MANHGLRTTGRPTGNFGKTKVRAGARLNDIGRTDAEVVRVIEPSVYEARLREALSKTTDAKLIAFLKGELHKLEVQRGQGLRRVAPQRAQPFRQPGC